MTGVTSNTQQRPRHTEARKTVLIRLWEDAGLLGVPEDEPAGALLHEAPAEVIAVHELGVVLAVDAEVLTPLNLLLGAPVLALPALLVDARQKGLIPPRLAGTLLLVAVPGEVALDEPALEAVLVVQARGTAGDARVALLAALRADGEDFLFLGAEVFNDGGGASSWDDEC